MTINLVSGPRNISTALMYSFAQRSDMAVVDEPFYAAYLDQYGAIHPGMEEVLAAQSHKPMEVWEGLQNFSAPHLFIKNMAHHMMGLPEHWWLNTKNVFLVRDPKEIITSFAKVIPKPSMQDIGLAAQVHFLELLTKSGQRAIVVDMEQLLRNPKETLSTLCEALELPFSGSMLSWPSGPIPEDGVWAKYWYKSVHRSTGFGPYVKKKEQLPEGLRPLYNEALKYYNELKAHAIIN